MISIPAQGTKARSLIKTISWRIVASFTTMIIVYIFTGKVLVAATVGLVEVIVKMALYYFHERVWNQV